MCKGPGKDWQRCLSCSRPDCDYDGVTNWERQQAARVDELACRESGERSERSKKRAARYQANKEAARAYYLANKARYSAYYQANRTKLLERSTERYHSKVKPSFD